LKKLLKKLLGERRLGFIDYHRFPEARAPWGGPFNGQLERVAMVRSLLRLAPDFIVETGTFRGVTTEFLARESACPVVTVEIHERSFGFAQGRLWRLRQVEMIKGDSRSAIQQVAQRPGLANKFPLFYLDAHWGEDLPLAEEIDLAFTHWPRAIILIDDFQVADDSGYLFDDYGSGKALTLDFTARVRELHHLHTFFPATPASQATGHKRGCVVFVKDADLAARVRAIPDLREYSVRHQG
jgi:hypothetical protein